MNQRIPVTVITGFLGSGKTTLLRHLLKKGRKKLAVIVNEFGSVGIDGDLIKSCGFCPEDELEGRLVELNNGCLCCTVQDEFLPTMEALISRSETIEGILIETSGLALPLPLLQALNWPSIRAKVHINGVVTIVDGEALALGSPVGNVLNIEKQRSEDPNLDHLTSIDDLFSRQLNAADIVLVSRSDLLSDSQLELVKDSIALRVRKGTQIFQVPNGQIDPIIILGLDNDYSNISNGEDHDHKHLEISSTNIRLELNIKEDELKCKLPNIAMDNKILRLKGRLWLPGKLIPLQIQMVGPRLNYWYEIAPKDAWRPNYSGIDLVVLGLEKNLEDKISKELKMIVEN